MNSKEERSLELEPLLKSNVVKPDAPIRKKEDSPKQRFVEQFRCVPSEVLTTLDTYFETDDYQRACASFNLSTLGYWCSSFEYDLSTFLPFSSKPFSEYQHLYGTITTSEVAPKSCGSVPLHSAALAGNVDALRFLMDAPYHLDPATGLNKMEGTALHWAASNGQTASLRLLMGAPYHANPNLKHFNKGTVLDHAIKCGQRETAVFLINALELLKPQENDGLINTAPKALPKKIHFVWIGGAIPEKYLATIEKMTWLARKSEFDISLWTDNPTIIAKTFAKMHPHVDADVSIPYLKIRNIQELNNEEMHSSTLYAEGRFRQFWHCVNRERVGLQNLAAASDLLRYEILRQEGGYYFDTDLRFYLSSTDKLVSDEPILGLKVRARFCSLNGFYGFNNNIIGALEGHEVLEGAIRVALRRYASLDKAIVSDLKLVNHKKKNPEGAERWIELDGEHYSFVHPDSKNAIHNGQTFFNSMNAMDLKRYSEIPAPRDENSSARWILTLAASGPGALICALTLSKYCTDKAYYALALSKYYEAYCKGSAVPASPLSCSTIDSSIANITVRSICDNTWYARSTCAIAVITSQRAARGISNVLPKSHVGLIFCGNDVYGLTSKLTYPYLIDSETIEKNKEELQRLRQLVYIDNSYKLMYTDNMRTVFKVLGLKPAKPQAFDDSSISTVVMPHCSHRL